MEEQDSTVQEIEEYVNRAEKALAGIKGYPGTAFAFVREAFWDVVNTAVVNILKHHLNKVALTFETDSTGWRSQEWNGHNAVLLLTHDTGTLKIPIPILKKLVDRKTLNKIRNKTMNYEQIKDEDLYHLFTVVEVLNAANIPAEVRDALEGCPSQEVRIFLSKGWFGEKVIAIRSVDDESYMPVFGKSFSLSLPIENAEWLLELLSTREISPFYYIESSSVVPNLEELAALRHAATHGASIKFVELPKKSSNPCYRLISDVQRNYPQVNIYLDWNGVYAHPESDRFHYVDYHGEISQPWHPWPKDQLYSLVYANFSEGGFRSDAFFIIDRKLKRVSGGFPLTDDFGKMDNVNKILRLWNKFGPEYIYRKIMQTFKLGYSDDFYNKLEIAFGGVAPIMISDQLGLTPINQLVAVDATGEIYLRVGFFNGHYKERWWQSKEIPKVRTLANWDDFVFRASTGELYAPMFLIHLKGDISSEDAAKCFALTQPGISLVEYRGSSEDIHPPYASFSGETAPFEYQGKTYIARGTGQLGELVKGIELIEVEA